MSYSINKPKPHMLFASKTVWFAENLNEIKITHYENIFSNIKQKFSHFEKGLEITFFLSH